jgi:6,7-dimethyl-8-ribityllumazine synthase
MTDLTTGRTATIQGTVAGEARAKAAFADTNASTSREDFEAAAGKHLTVAGRKEGLISLGATFGGHSYRADFTTGGLAPTMTNTDLVTGRYVSYASDNATQRAKADAALTEVNGAKSEADMKALGAKLVKTNSKDGVLVIGATIDGFAYRAEYVQGQDVPNMTRTNLLNGDYAVYQINGNATEVLAGNAMKNLAGVTDAKGFDQVAKTSLTESTKAKGLVAIGKTIDGVALRAEYRPEDGITTAPVVTATDLATGSRVSRIAGKGEALGNAVMQRLNKEATADGF